MHVRFVEVTNGPNNWGKFLVGKFDEEEWDYGSVVSEGFYLLRARGWSKHHLLVLDLETGEGGMFLPQAHASAAADLRKHRIHVCPMFEPFLEWLYQQPDPMDIEPHIDLPAAPFALYGYRRSGIDDKALYYSPDRLPLCGKHVVKAYEHMRPRYLPDARIVEVDSVSRELLQLKCAMCGQVPSPGRTCGHCGTPLDELWPAVYCSNRCALEDR